MSFTVEHEQRRDADEIERLLDTVFGPDRRRRTAYRFREPSGPVDGLGFVIREDGVLTGTIRFWPARIAPEDDERQTPALLLGPLGIAREAHGRGRGTALLHRGLAEALQQGHRHIFLIGDLPYYGRVGFRSVLPAVCRMPGPVDPARVLAWTAAPNLELPTRFALEPAGEASERAAAMRR